MDGMSLLLKAAGFDAAEFQTFITGMKAYMLKVNADLDAIKTAQDEIKRSLALTLSMLESQQQKPAQPRAHRKNDHAN